MIEMNLHKALSYKKLLEKRIAKANRSITSIGYKMNSANTEYNTKLTVDDFCKKAKASVIQAKALIENYNKVCQAITLSNAKTKVEINGLQMTVSDAINRKNNIDKEEELLRTLKINYRDALEEVERKNEKLEDRIDTLRENDKKNDIDKQNNYYDSMRENESWSLIDPLNMREYIEKMEDDIETFKSEVDFVLSTSNAKTIVKIDIDEI